MQMTRVRLEKLSRPVPDFSNNHCLSVGMTRMSYFLVSYCDIIKSITMQYSYVIGDKYIQEF